MASIIKSLDRLRQEAKKLSKTSGIKHSKALEEIARLHGYPDWKSAVNSQTTHKSTANNLAYQDNEVNGVKDRTVYYTTTLKKTSDLDELVSQNKAYLISIGIEFSFFTPTRTGLSKSILDATYPIRNHFEALKFHSFNEQQQGSDYKVIKTAYFLNEQSITQTKVSLYRPETKKGDPRMWFSKLPEFSFPDEIIAIVIHNDDLFLINLNRELLESQSFEGEIHKFFKRYLEIKNSIAEELLAKLKLISQTPIRSIIKGDTAVGMAVEAALNIAANSSKEPDYKGIEIKSGRGGKNRSNLFAQVADWDISNCKSSADILNKYGYQRDDDFKLYCTVSAKKPNSQGLSFIYDEQLDQLIEKDIEGNSVAIWRGKTLRDRLLSKHAETFWIDAKSTVINEEEYFTLISVTHTQKPVASQLLPLIESGIITMDHLIKRKSDHSSHAKEKGPLFKIDKSNIKYLFPEPKVYKLAD